MGALCCSDHLYNGHLNYESLWQINGSLADRLILDSDATDSLLNDFRSAIQTVNVFDFDDPSCLKDETYYNITGLKKGTHTDSSFPFRMS